MCGIAALFSPKGKASQEVIRAMCDIIRHRGPDGEGYVHFIGERVWRSNGPETPPDARTLDVETSSNAEIILGHRRLAIIELTSAGHQPMTSHGERYWITFNGEIYNHLELRAELTLLGSNFNTSSDTEVILAAYEKWGNQCLHRLNGMFAFVIYDRLKKCVFVARDRYGVKPLYRWQAPDGTLAFASEIKQFTVIPGWRARLDGQRAYEYLNWGLTDHTEFTLFKDVAQLPPGTFVQFELAQASCLPLPTRWYQIGEQTPESSLDSVKSWRNLFLKAVSLRLRADVPVGTALSGGLDSSSIVMAVARQRKEMNPFVKQNAFTARSHDPELDEGVYADVVAKAAMVEAHKVWPDAPSLFEELSKLAWYMDEPFGSTSVFAEWSVFKTVSQTSVKVTLDGHGADEILAGYKTFCSSYLADLLTRGRILNFLSEFKTLIDSRKFSFFNLTASVFDEVAPSYLRLIVRQLVDHTTNRPDWINFDKIGAIPSEPFKELSSVGIYNHSVSQIKATSLPMQLHWNDRNSMAHSIESRAPFLDYKLLEYTLALPDSLKLANGVSKVVLRQALSDMLPEKIRSRRDKIGFATAEEVWATRDMPEMFQRLATKAIDRSEGILNEAARQRVLDMVHGRRRYHVSLWRIISFGVWLESFDVAVNK